MDDDTGQVLAGDTSEHSWEERWRFMRDPQADTLASDERHEITFDRAGQWMVGSLRPGLSHKSRDCQPASVRVIGQTRQAGGQVRDTPAARIPI